MQDRFGAAATVQFVVGTIVRTDGNEASHQHAPPSMSITYKEVYIPRLDLLTRSS